MRIERGRASLCPLPDLQIILRPLLAFNQSRYATDLTELALRRKLKATAVNNASVDQTIEILSGHVQKEIAGSVYAGQR